jgi:HlyD family secretion protein
MKTTFFLFFSVLIFSGCSQESKKSDAYGNFESREIIVAAESQGKIISLNVEEGDIISSGKTVGWIDTATFSVKKEQLRARKRATASKLQNIESQIEVQKEQIDNLQTEKQRIEKLLKEEAATEQQYDNITGKLKVAKKQLESIKTQKTSVYRELEVINTQVKEINTNIDRCRVENPIKGTVLEKYMEPGEVAGPGMALYKIADLSRMDLRVYVSGAQLPHIKLGEEVEVLIDKNDEENQVLSGKIVWISDKAEFTPKIIQTKEDRVDLVYAVKIRVKNDGRIKIGMPGEANFKN